MGRSARLAVPFIVTLAATFALCGAVAARVSPAADAPPDFVREVLPIFSASCIRCHGPGESKALLRLDSEALFREGGDSGEIVVAGDPAGSLLYRKVTSTDPKHRMPQEAAALDPAQIETIRRWIASGAAWPDGVTIQVAEARPAALPARPTSRPRNPRHLSYNRDVRPILAENCFPCHGPDKAARKAGLRLDREEIAKGTLASGTVPVVAGAPDKSALVARLLHADEERRMPLAKSGRARLSSEQIATLRRWIAEGAEWEPHWAYIPPVRPKPPATRESRWARNAVDAFILAGVEKARLRPSPEASRAQLLRRLSFDLTGLPPTPEEVQAFETDTRKDAYERQVDRLLASPRFGERMALFWLDLVRYSDSVGYHSDNARPMWRYRDWVVQAWNANLPFDRFTAEQLAGDLLPDASDADRIASGYNRLLQTTEEGGAQPKEYRAIYLADRVRNASSVWMGATLGCAQCHDHKFDPYLQRDFYAFSAFFADINELPVGRRKPDVLPDAAQKPGLDALDAKVKQRKSALEAAQPTAEWEKALAARRVAKFTTLEPVLATSANGTRVMIQGNDFSIIASTSNGPKPPTDTYTVRFKTELERLTALRLEAQTFEELPRGGPGRDPTGGFVVSEIEVRDAAGRPLALQNATASTPDGDGSSAAAAIDGNTKDGGWALRTADGESHRLVVELEAPVVREGETTTLTLVVHQNAGGLRTLGRLRLAGTSDALAVRTTPGPEPWSDLIEAAALDPKARSKDQQTSLAKFYRREAAELAPARAELRAAELERQALVDALPQPYVTTTQEPEPVHVLPRGNWLDDSGEVVTPAAPQFLQAAASGSAAGRATRLDLARWLTSRDNPLTARVLANRLWKVCFGQGLSRSVEDLGAQGEWPTHPELLDWLALELVDGGWDVKHLLRTLVTSATYRQSSRLTPEALEKDPANRLYARQSRYRLDAELVRDNALAVSGLLASRLGGPSVFPYQPAGYWAYLNFPPREWDASPGDDQYRRGLYTWWQRTFPQPSLVAFDAPSREECTGERVRSNVPQQALALLGDPSYVEAARVFAERILRDGGTSVASRLRFAYARALQRAPNPAEQSVLEELLRRGQDEFGRDPAAAGRLVATGQHEVAADLPAVELAAWTQVARAILNLPELVTRS
ncbi:MAG TPA: PSD1 and planctomycete cytochrome C domain-containing protein [Vicinamibacteria bacterium]